MRFPGARIIFCIMGEDELGPPAEQFAPQTRPEVLQMLWVIDVCLELCDKREVSERRRAEGHIILPLYQHA